MVLFLVILVLVVSTSGITGNQLQENLCSTFGSSCVIECFGQQVISAQYKILTLSSTCESVTFSDCSPTGSFNSDLNHCTLIGQIFSQGKYYYEFLLKRNIDPNESISSFDFLFQHNDQECYISELSKCSNDVTYLPCNSDSDCTPNGLPTGIFTTNCNQNENNVQRCVNNQCNEPKAAFGTPCAKASLEYPCGAATCSQESIFCDVTDPVPYGTPCFPFDTTTRNRTDENGCDFGQTCSGTTAKYCMAEATPAVAGTPCRSPTGSDCDSGGRCNGENLYCPPNEPKPTGTLCREMNGRCDVEEFCNGESLDCPFDALRSSGTVCRDGNDECDPEEHCTGVSADCPNDEFASSGTICRESFGPCDIEETCSGDKPDCPDDLFKEATFKCGNASKLEGNECDSDDFCTGSSAECPDSYKPLGFVCKSKDQNDDHLCQKDATCSGTTAQCPDGEIEENGVVCRESQGLCDIPEYCNGTSLDCPSDIIKTSNVQCQASSGPCEEDSYCDGTSTECPENGYLPSTKKCRDSNGPCDKPEYCSGHSSECPQNSYLSSQTMCRSSSTGCDEPEYCTGKSGECPKDIHRDRAYGFQCGISLYFCGVNSKAELTFRSGVGVFANFVFESFRDFYALPWPYCLDVCLPKKCPNGKDMINYYEAQCSIKTKLNETKIWDGLKKIVVQTSTKFPICPSFGQIKSSSSDHHPILKLSSEDIKTMASKENVIISSLFLILFFFLISLLIN